MKKLIVFGSAAVLLLTVASCQKEYTCECTDLAGIAVIDERTEKGKNAEEACENAETKVLGVSADSCTEKK